MRVLLSQQFKRTFAIKYPRAQSRLASQFGLDPSQLSNFMADRLGVGPVTRARLVRLGAHIGLAESQCFRVARRG